jgi:hypothetical protein
VAFWRSARPGSCLAGTYAGASAEVTVGGGIGANMLVGGSFRTVELQPFTVQEQTGSTSQQGWPGQMRLPTLGSRISCTNCGAVGSGRTGRNSATGDADRGAMAKLSDKQRAALRMLDASARGYSLSTMAARGFDLEMLHDLVHAGWATVHRGAFGPGTSKIVSLRITEAGRKAIAE